ncbi:hypothetical protein SDC9_161364 [bioreactor metagenome]|uniref:Uncharacterized protein n=1 Tax=bioreactor metagenome TaxID=1076179 RepID=A0A645FI09_9ZZZZ
MFSLGLIEHMFGDERAGGLFVGFAFLTQNGEDGIEQFFLADGFQQIGRTPHALQTSCISAMPHRGEDDHFGRAKLRVHFDLFEHPFTIHFWHLHVQ